MSDRIRTLHDSQPTIDSLPNATPEQVELVERTTPHDIRSYCGLTGYKWGEPGFGGDAA